MSARAHDQQLRVVIGGDPAQAVGDSVVKRHHDMRILDAAVAQQSLDARPRLGAPGRREITVTTGRRPERQP